MVTLKANLTQSAILLFVCCSPNLALAGDTEDQPQSTVFYTEFTGARHDSDLYSAVETALNRDFGRDGVLFRVEGTYNAFSYDNIISDIARRIDGTEWQGGALIGYQMVRGSMTYSGYVGVDFQSIHLSPNDVTNPIRGEEVGAKFAGEIESERDGPLYFDLVGEYSTAFETFFTRGRAGYDFKLGHESTQFAAGPEVSFLGDSDFDARRLGAFVLVPVTLPSGRSVSVLAAGGYQWVSNNDNLATGQTAGVAGGQGPYFTTSFAISF